MSKSMTAYDHFLLGACFGRSPEARCMIPAAFDKLTTTEERWAFAQGMRGDVGVLGPENFEEMRKRAFEPSHVIMSGNCVVATISELGMMSPELLCTAFDHWMAEQNGRGLEGYYTSKEERKRIGEIPSFYVSLDQAKRTSASELRTRFDKWLLEHSDSESAAEQPLYAGRIVAVLDCLLELDRAGLSAVLMTRHPVSEALADHPSTISSPDGQLGALGLLNGLLPKRADGRGIIVVDYDEETGFIQRFRLVTDSSPRPVVLDAIQGTSAPAALPFTNHDVMALCQAVLKNDDRWMREQARWMLTALSPPRPDWRGKYKLTWPHHEERIKEDAEAIELKIDTIMLRYDEKVIAFDRLTGVSQESPLKIAAEDLPRIRPEVCSECQAPAVAAVTVPMRRQATSDQRYPTCKEHLAQFAQQPGAEVRSYPEIALGAHHETHSFVDISDDIKINEEDVTRCEEETNRAVEGAQNAALPPPLDWTGEYLLDWNGAPKKSALAVALRGDVIVLKCADDELAFNRDNGQCVTGEHRGQLWISQDDMPRVKPQRESAPCTEPAKMNGFSDQFPGTDDPEATPLPPPAPLVE